jgi:hypothetical protein
MLSPAGVAVKSRPLDGMFDLLKKGKLYSWVEFIDFKTNDPISALQYFNSHSNEYFLGDKILSLQRLFGLLEGTSRFEKARLYSEIDQFLIKQHYVKPILHLNRLFIHRKSISNIGFLKGTRYKSGWHEVYSTDEN